MTSETQRFPWQRVEAQMAAIFSAWGMRPERARDTAAVLIWADLRGVDSHGIGMIGPYGRLLAEGSITMDPTSRIVAETSVTATFDAGGGLGHCVSIEAMDRVVEKARASGLAAAAVRNSHHFGAAGFYAERAVRAGLIGLAFTSVHRPTVVPTFGAEPMFGTNPIAFAAPARRNPPFFLDMATSTSALGKVLVAARAGKTLPEGTALDAEGRPERNARRAFEARRLTPLGATPELASHKGYGLAVMVEILCTTLAGATFGATRGPRAPGDPWDVGHFFLAIDPGAFRDPETFGDDLDGMIDALRGTRPSDPERPVQVAGDPEEAERARRLERGIPLGPELLAEVRGVASAAGAEILL